MVQILRPIPVAQLKLFVFDLDGTLVDSALDLSNSVNASLAHFGEPTLPNELVASFVGNGVPLLLRRSLGAISGVQPEEVENERFERIQGYFLEHYGQHLLDNTRLYAGAKETIDAISKLHEQKGGEPRILAVLTNKPEAPSKAICAGLGLTPYFARIYGGNTFATRKPDPEGLLHLMRELGITAEETVMIGDSKGDVQVARNANTWSIGSAFGFGPQNLMETPPDIRVETAWEWKDVLIP